MSEDKAKRANGEGSVYRLSDGTYMVVITAPDGRRVRRKPTVQTQTGADRLLRTLLRKRDEGSLTRGSLNLAQFAPQYMTAVRLRGVRSRTLEAYQEKLDRHIIPTLGGTRLDKLTAGQVEKLYADKIAAGLSPGTVGMIHQVLGQLLKAAKRRRLVGQVATDDIDPPKRERFRARPLTRTEASALLRSIRDHRHGPFWTFMLGTGARFGEAAGLTWSAVDLDAGTAGIRQAVTRRRKDGHVSLAIDRVKTDAGNRDVALPDWAVAALRAQRVRVAEMRLVAGRGWEDRDLVFPNRSGGPLAENHVLVTWHRALARVEVPGGSAFPKIRMHDLRHTKGTIMADEGEETLVIQRTLGHAQQSITADLYVGKVPKAMRGAADRYGALLDPGAEAAG